MKYEGKAKLLRIYLNKYTHAESELLYEVIVKKAHKTGLAGAVAETVLWTQV